MPEVRAARTAATRARIAAAALDQVAAGGYASASVTAVAGRAGVAAGSVYTHFPSKADLFAEVFRDASERELAIVNEIAARTGESVPERLAEAVEAWARRALASPTLAWALMAEPVDPEIETARVEAKRRYRDVFARLLDEGVSRGEINAVDVRTAAAAIVGAMQESLVGPMAETTAGAGLVPALVAFVLHAVSANEPGRRRTRKKRS